MRWLMDYENRIVRLTEERLVHIRQHPEMENMVHAIGEALASPAFVRQSCSDTQTNLYYRHYEQTFVGPKWLCVVIKATGNDCFVLTAYLTDKPKEGIRWTPLSRQIFHGFIVTQTPSIQGNYSK